jgi:hypothetical protein
MKSEVVGICFQAQYGNMNPAIWYKATAPIYHHPGPALPGQSVKYTIPIARALDEPSDRYIY